MKLLIILQIVVNSFVIDATTDSIYTTTDSCRQANSFPVIKKDKFSFSYNNYYYVLSYIVTKEVHYTRHSWHMTPETYIYALGRMYNQTYHIRIHKYRERTSIWVIPIRFSKNEYKRMRGFLFTDSEEIIKKLKCSKTK